MSRELIRQEVSKQMLRQEIIAIKGLVDLTGRIVKLLEKLMPDVYRLKVIVGILLGVWVGKQIYSFVKFVRPYFDGYIRYARYLYEAASPDAKLNIAFIIPVTALGSFLCYKFVPKIFKNALRIRGK